MKHISFLKQINRREELTIIFFNNNQTTIYILSLFIRIKNYCHTLEIKCKQSKKYDKIPFELKSNKIHIKYIENIKRQTHENKEKRNICKYTYVCI